MGERITIEIPGIVPTALVSQRAWWRWRHHGRVSWRDKVQQAIDAAGLSGEYMLHAVRVDWGKTRVWIGDVGRDRLVREVLDAVEPPLGIWLYPAVHEEQSGRGRGTTWIELQRV